MLRSICTRSAALLAVAVLATQAFAQTPKVYYVETQFGPPLQWEAEIDGSNESQFVIMPASDFLCQGMVFSPTHSQLYYCNKNGGFSTVFRINSDGTGRTVLLGGLSDARGIEADFDNGHLYFVDRVQRIIYRLNTDGTGITLLATGSRFERLALDLPNGKIYFGNSTDRTIERMDLDGSNREVVIGNPAVDQPAGICIDSAAGKIFWADGDRNTSYIASCNTDGTGFQVLHQSSTVDLGLLDIDIDVQSQTLFWVDEAGPGEKGFWLSSTDGSGARRFRATGGTAGLSPTTILVSTDPAGAPGCATGNVNEAAGDITNVVFINGSAGGEDRQVELNDGTPITAAIALPPAGGNGRYVVHGNLGRADGSMVTPLPRDIGSPCYPILTRDGATPVIVANAARNEDRIGENMFFGESTPAPPRAPAAFMQRTSDPNLSPGTIVSFQGAMFDPGATSPKGASVTNLVTLVIQ